MRRGTRLPVGILSLLMPMLLASRAVAAPQGFEGFQFTPPYNTTNPFSKAQLEIISKGFDVFMTKTFDGNSRTCGTCHIPESNYNVTAADIAGMKASDKQRVLGGSNPGLENAEIVETLALFNVDQGFGAESAGNLGEPAGPFRASMSIGGVGFSVLNNYVCRPEPTCSPPPTPTPGNNAVDDGVRDIMLGWAGDGSLVEMFQHADTPPADSAACETAINSFASDLTNLDKALATFALAAVKTHFTRTQGRVPGTDFTCPTADDLETMAKFQEWLGRRFELDITKLHFGSTATEQGRILFSTRKASCVACHVNAGASDTQGRVKNNPVPFLALDGTADPDPTGPVPLEIIGSNKASRNGASFFEPEIDGFVAASISNPPSNPASPFSPFAPYDEGDGELRSGGEPGFNVQSIIEAVRKPQFFHNNGVEGGIEDAIAHYFSDKFDQSQGGGAVRNAFRGGITGSNVLADLGGADAINKIGLFLRTLSSIYALADCERFLNEAIDRVNYGLPTALPVRHCRIGLTSAGQMLAGARVTPNPYKFVPVALFGAGVLMMDAERTKNAGAKKAKLLATRVSLTAIRRVLVRTPELP